MLAPDWINQNIDDITIMTADMQTAILSSIAKHVSDSLKVQTGIMPSTAKQIEAAQIAGILREDIARHVAEYLSISIPDVRALFEAAGVETLRYDNEIYREAGLPPIVYQQSPQMQRTLESRIGRFTGTLRRLTGTIAINSEELFERTLNTAYNQVVSGAESYTTALNNAMDDMARQGIGIFQYESGREISVEAAILLNIRTSVSQAAAAITEQSMIERGVSYVEASAHQGARNKGEGFKNHESWQGLFFYYSEIAVQPNDENLPDFIKTTGYKDVAGLCGAGCRHSFSPAFPGITQPRWSSEELAKYAAKTVKYINHKTGEEKEIPLADANEHLRYLERMLRDWKRREQIKESAGLPADVEKKKVREWQERIRTFTKESGLRRQHFRERVAQV